MNFSGVNTSNLFDAIVIGSGISGGWAAMELSKQGLKTLLLERGGDVKHIVGYTTSDMQPWDFPNGQNNTNDDIFNDPVQSQIYSPENRHFFVRDNVHPYVQERPFNWFRGYQVGGRSLVWGRQCYRLSDLDFGANLEDGHGVDWPVRYKDIEPWYDYVESFIGVSGRKEGLGHLPDGNFLPPMELNCVEKHLADSLKNDPVKKILTIARVANLTRGWNGRGPCLYRNLCSRGCPYGGYFSSNSSTIPLGLKTGNLTLRPLSIVTKILYDDRTKKATGVVVLDSVSKEHIEFKSKIIFVNASTINTAAILLNSRSYRFPNGLGNDSGELGHNLMDHHSSAGATGIFDGFKNKYYKGRRPCGFLIPRFKNLSSSENNSFLRGYNFQGYGLREGWEYASRIDGFGRDFKERLLSPGPWRVWMGAWGECLPYHENKVSLDYQNEDSWGMPMIKINFEYKRNERMMMSDAEATAAKILQGAGFREIESFNYNKPGGSTVHEMGSARMGKNSQTSVLNGFNQIHDVKNVFVTDGSFMSSSACQNPSLTYMAFTARACAFAVNALKKGDL